jgi:hypothetical protein
VAGPILPIRVGLGGEKSRQTRAGERLDGRKVAGPEQPSDEVEVRFPLKQRPDDPVEVLKEVDPGADRDVGKTTIRLPPHLLVERGLLADAAEQDGNCEDGRCLEEVDRCNTACFGILPAAVATQDRGERKRQVIEPRIDHPALVESR